MVVTEEGVQGALAQVIHPEIDHTLVELGMVKDIVVGDDKVTLTLVLPFIGIPIQDLLVASLRNAIKELNSDVTIEVNQGLMTEKERETFFAMAQEAWRGP
jgi:metal-sulfur cluster biosynthetic enzyme